MSAAPPTSGRFWASNLAPAHGIDGAWRMLASPDQRERALSLVEPHFVPPDGCADLILHYRGGRFEQAFMQAPTVRFEIVSVDANDSLFGVRFQLGLGGWD